MNSKIKVSGNIIGELSEKIPTNIIALNELIKNSYDAGASFVSIELNTSKKLLIIKDDGSGMDKDAIDTLFHISKSNKIHGEINEYGRITQGSKGLGFLSVFKFGPNVQWKTKKESGFYFSVNYNELISLDDISNHEIELIADQSINKGTEIIIQIDDYNVKSLKNYFSIEKYYKKILNSFNDKNFIINLTIDDMSYSSREIKSFLENEKKQQLYHITYNSTDQKLIFCHNNKYKIIKEYFPFESTEYRLEMDLLAFEFKPHGKEKIDKYKR